MKRQPTLLASAALSALASMACAPHAQAQSAPAPIALPEALPTVTVTAAAFRAAEGEQILAPAKVLSGHELSDKLGASLGDILSHELGVSSSAFGAGASRPIIRGLEGARVKVLQNGMGVADVSSLSNDHAVGVGGPGTRQIEILRGPAALLYGSGAIGGLVNVVNERIPTGLEPEPTGMAELRHGSADRSGAASVSVDGSVGSIGLHLDGSVQDARDYRIPGDRVRDDPASGSGRLAGSYAGTHELGLGASLLGTWGHVGMSISQLDKRYGIPTDEGASIDLSQARYDLDALVHEPFGAESAIETFQLKLGHTDYRHSELNAEGEPETHFKNRAFESRWEFTHREVAGWRGRVGLQTEESKFSALSAEAGGEGTVPITRSTSMAAFMVQERAVGPVRVNAGLRLEHVKRRPEGGQQARTFDLVSYSAGGLWPFVPGYGLGATVSVAQRAPATEELYVNGPHEATGTFDIGDARFKKETSHNLELSLQKTTGRWRWKANLFHNQVKDFIYGQLTGRLLGDDGLPGDELQERSFAQADATIRGAEAELSYNLQGQGLSWRGFADASRGSLDQGGGSLPLQPASRVGADIGFKQGPWRTGASVIHARAQERMAASETRTPSYTRVDAQLSYVQRVGAHELTWFLLAKNLLDEDIRLSTSVLKDEAPLPGRNFVMGVRTRF